MTFFKGLTMRIKTIIFDLGNVLMPLNMEKTYKAFDLLGVKDAKTLFESKTLQELYVRYEHNMKTAEFRTQLREKLSLTKSITDHQIDAAWVAMLDDIPEGRLDYILGLRKQGYNVILLSNSNEIHHANIQKRYGKIFGELFNTQHYSHLLNMTKPNEDIFLYVVNEKDAGEFFFLDDKATNIAGAKKTGIQAMQFTVHQSFLLVDDMLTRINRDATYCKHNNHDKYEENRPETNNFFLLKTFAGLAAMGGIALIIVGILLTQPGLLIGGVAIAGSAALSLSTFFSKKTQEKITEPQEFSDGFVISSPLL
jgi:FMN phosphatase YigB (HAD superfamily)